MHHDHQHNFRVANPHCLDQLIRSSERQTLIARDDIVDERGIKLWARGRPVNAALSERLSTRRLLKPLESSLQFTESLGGSYLRTVAESLFDKLLPLTLLTDGKHRHIGSLLGGVELSGAASLLLSAQAHNDPIALQHAVLVAIIGCSLTLSLHGSESMAQECLYAGLAHDLGELYVDPELLAANRALSHREWRTVVVHPITGALVVQQLGQFPASVGRAIREHHERLDGTGYPAASRNAQLSPLGQILMTAETLAAILPTQENPEARALLALRLIPGQYPRAATALVSRVFRSAVVAMPMEFDLPTLQVSAKQLLDGLGFARQTAKTLSTAADLSDEQRSLASQVRTLTIQLEMALHASGALAALDASLHDFHKDPSIANELLVVIRELLWRKRSLARHVELCAERIGKPPGRLHELVAAFETNGPACTTIREVHRHTS